ncbi:MAG TPA: hypothetical protein VK656_05515, partial [Candidatus Acidoferrum sp.]|nr:hypothetical protein [Candidatus Acidoferrum sp.]
MSGGYVGSKYLPSDRGWHLRHENVVLTRPMMQAGGMRIGVGMRRIGYLAGALLFIVGAIYVARHYRPAPSPQPPHAACQPVAADPIACSTIDGFPIGTYGTDCSVSPSPCTQEEMASDGFGVRDPGHPQ